MREFEISEIFLSLEGEGPFTNRPTIYVRFARCNFKCPLFNNPVKAKDDKGYALLDFTPKDYNNLVDIPIIHRGCDSQYAVNPDFSHMWKRMTADDIARELIDKLPNGQWKYPNTNLPVILSLTGGEPTLQWKHLKELLDHPLLRECEHILTETNCAVPFGEEFIVDINNWLVDGWNHGYPRRWTWSNSPKLSSSGELWTRAIKPNVATMQRSIHPAPNYQYFKFVVDPTNRSFEEVGRAMEEYYAAGVPRDVEVWIMPQACTEEQQQEVSKYVATECLKRGYCYSHRVQNSVWGNGVGT